jgi:hypothetical protein
MPGTHQLLWRVPNPRRWQVRHLGVRAVQCVSQGGPGVSCGGLEGGRAGAGRKQQPGQEKTVNKSTDLNFHRLEATWEHASQWQTEAGYCDPSLSQTFGQN